MGTAISSDQRPLSAVESLAREKPTQLMAQLRAVWPQVQEALKAGHTLRLIHKRLNMSGVPISYKVLSVYRGRIERRKKGLAAPGLSHLVVTGQDAAGIRPAGQFARAGTETEGLAVSVRTPRRKQAHLKKRCFKKSHGREFDRSRARNDAGWHHHAPHLANVHAGKTRRTFHSR